MTLRLSSSSLTKSPEDYILELTEDSSISLVQKIDCLKTLGVVLKNLIDASKGGAEGPAGLKYRTLKLDNPKLKARLFCCQSGSGNCVKALLKDPSLVGMIEKESTLVLEEPPSSTIHDSIALRVLPVVQTATANNSQQYSNDKQHKKPKLTDHNSTTTNSVRALENLSEKQKARRLLEEKKRLEKEQDRLYRKQTRAQLAADKKVRMHDENWKPSVSAAADKTGTGLQTFRDRHGE